MAQSDSAAPQNRRATCAVTGIEVSRKRQCARVAGRTILPGNLALQPGWLPTDSIVAHVYFLRTAQSPGRAWPGSRPAGPGIPNRSAGYPPAHAAATNAKLFPRGHFEVRVILAHLMLR